MPDRARSLRNAQSALQLAHDPEKWEPVFGSNHAQGKLMALDSRTNAYRPDLAAKHLQGQVEARHFVDGVRHQGLDQIADRRPEPTHEAPLDTQALPGETVMVYETSDEGWCWGQLEND